MRSEPLVYYRQRWPDAEVPADAPVWLHFEVSPSADAVLRTVEVFGNGSITRNSLAIEQRNGDHCPSLIDCSLAEGFEGMALEPIVAAAFEALWEQGVDAPFWFPNDPPR
ncbi:MAG TPA: hypothetical protein VFV30_01275 [Novosphingobium sp.]|nr:hypothetical protein [Novosphingobium sp.]